MFGSNKISEIVEQIAKETERVMLVQLQDLIKDGALVWEESVPVIIKDHSSNAFKIVKYGHFHLKVQEKLDELRAENANLKHRLENIRLATEQS